MYKTCRMDAPTEVKSCKHHFIGTGFVLAGRRASITQNNRLAFSPTPGPLKKKVAAYQASGFENRLRGNKYRYEIHDSLKSFAAAHLEKSSLSVTFVNFTCFATASPMHTQLL